MNLDPVQIGCQLAVIFLAVGIHEYAHCKFADLAGDPTPRYYGRVTLNLFKHFDPMGSMMIVLSSISGFGIGWGKPAPMDPSKMKNPRWDFFIAVLAGPLSNFCQAVVYAFLFRLLAGHPSAGQLSDLGTVPFVLVLGVVINIQLMLFNLIPFGPLDGHFLLGLLLPEGPRKKWFLLNQRIGFFGLIALVLLLRTGPAQSILIKPMFSLAFSLLGLK